MTYSHVSKIQTTFSVPRCLDARGLGALHVMGRVGPISISKLLPWGLPGHQHQSSGPREFVSLFGGPVGRRTVTLHGRSQTITSITRFAGMSAACDRNVAHASSAATSVMSRLGVHDATINQWENRAADAIHAATKAWVTSKEDAADASSLPNLSL